MSKKSSKYSCLCLVWTLLSLLITSATSAQPQLVDRIIAIAGDHAILYSEVRAKVASGPLVTVSDFPADASATRMQRAINDLINLHLVSTALAELDAGVSDAEVDQQINAFLQQKGLTRTDLDTFLQSQGKTYSAYRQDFKQQLLVRKFHGVLIVPAVKITEDDIKAYYLKKSGHIGDLVSLDLQQIFVPGKDKKLITEAYHSLQKGMPFDEALALYNEQQGSAVMRNVQLQELSPAIRDALRALPEGKFSTPLETAAGQHIFYVAKRRIAVDAAFNASKAELELELRALELENQTRLWLQKRRAQTNIKLLSAQNKPS